MAGPDQITQDTIDKCSHLLRYAAETINEKEKKAEKDKAPAKDKDAKDKKTDKKDDKKDEKKAGVPRPFTCVAFTPDGKKVVAGNLDGVIKIWDAETGKELGELKAHEGAWAIAFNSDGSRMASTCSGPSVSAAIAAVSAESIPPERPMTTPGKRFLRT